MAVVRIQSINVNSSLTKAIDHRINPPVDRETLVSVSEESPVFIPDFHEENLYDIKKYSSSLKEYLTEFIRYVESNGYTQKIRKNAVVQELVIAYSPEDFSSNSEEEIEGLIGEDIDLFLEFFEEKFGFRPYYIAFIHKNNNNSERMYHLHIIFSLKKPDLKTKVRWKKRTYFELVKKLASKSPRISVPHKGRNIGAYPLWIVRKLEEKYGRETAKEITKLARKKGYTARTLIENAEKLAKEVQPSEHPKSHPIPHPRDEFIEGKELF